MNIEQAKNIIAKINKPQRNMLSHAYERYMHFTGLYSSPQTEITLEQIAQDKIDFVHLLKFNEKGDPWISDIACIEFMSILTNLPELLCEAWEEIEFINEHGSVEELLALEARSKRRKEQDQLSTFFL